MSVTKQQRHSDTFTDLSHPAGRYPIHFHMSGDVTGSYVRGCAVHHTFNRAVTIHGVRGLLVERNVAYQVMGHAFFIEDGIETGNTIQYNLGVFVVTSSSLLNVDVTPAAFWITNPNNTGALYGSHKGGAVRAAYVRLGQFIGLHESETVGRAYIEGSTFCGAYVRVGQSVRST